MIGGTIVYGADWWTKEEEDEDDDVPVLTAL